MDRFRTARGQIGLVEPADVGSGRDDLIDAVEDIVGQCHVEPFEKVVELRDRARSDQGAGGSCPREGDRRLRGPRRGVAGLSSTGRRAGRVGRPVHRTRGHQARSRLGSALGGIRPSVRWQTTSWIDSSRRWTRCWPQVPTTCGRTSARRCCCTGVPCCVSRCPGKGSTTTGGWWMCSSTVCTSGPVARPTLLRDGERVVEGITAGDRVFSAP